MNASLFRAAAIACCGLLWSCGVYVPIQEPKTLAPGETSLMAVLTSTDFLDMTFLVNQTHCPVSIRLCRRFIPPSTLLDD